MHTVIFKIAKNNEAKKAGHVEEVKFNVNFDNVDFSLIESHAIKNMIVVWQGQIRANWDKFKDEGLPQEVTFGIPLYESRKAAPMTAEAAEKKILNGPRLQQVQLAIKLLEQSGMEIPEELLEEEYQLKNEASHQ